MKIICEKEQLIEGLSIAQKAIAIKSTFPILECFLLDTTNNQIKIVSNNTELGIETIINGEIVESGLCAIKAKTFFEIIRKMPQGNITIETVSDDDVNITYISSGNTKYNLNSFKGEDFTFLPYVEKESAIKISEKTLKNLITQTIFSISQNDNRIQMTGELFEIKNNELKVVALDGYRISEKRTNLNGINDDVKVIIPGKTLSEISKILSDETDKEVNIYITKNHIVFSFNKTTVISRLIEGEYFNVKQLMTNEYNTKIVVNKNNLYDSLERASILSREGEKNPLVFNITDKNIKIVIKSKQGNRFDEKVDIEKEGEDLIIGFNNDYLLDVLKVIKEEEITVYFLSQASPCFIRNENEKYNYLILPLKIKEEDYN